MALTEELSIYKPGCDLLSLALDIQTHMPRDFRRTLGEKIHVLCVDMLEDMAAANAYRRAERLAQLDKLLSRLRTLTALMRVGYEHPKKLIGRALWACSVELVENIGKQAGGWRKQTIADISAAPAV